MRNEQSGGGRVLQPDSAEIPVYVAAGSNVEPREKLRFALDALSERFGPLQVSQAYRNTAVGFSGDDFINLVVGFKTSLAVDELLSVLHEIENRCGRTRSAPKFGPRSMDLDVLLYGDSICSTPPLTLPRPDLVKRAYMLQPMAELAPQLEHPLLHKTFATLWREFDQTAHVMQPVEL